MILLQYFMCKLINLFIHLLIHSSTVTSYPCKGDSGSGPYPWINGCKLEETSIDTVR